MIATRKLAPSAVAALLAACTDPAASPLADATRDPTPVVDAFAEDDGAPRQGLLSPTRDLPPGEPRCGDLGPQRQPTRLDPDAPLRPRLDRTSRPFGPDPVSAYTIPLRSTEIDARVVGTTAELVVRHEFRNTLPTAVDARYAYPLQPGATVVDFKIRVGDRQLRGAVRRHRAGRSPAPADRFTQAIDRIPADAIVEVELRVVMPLRPNDGRYTLILPTAVGAPPVPNEPTVRSCGTLDVRIRLATGTPPADLRSELHTLTVVPLLGEVQLGLARELRPDRDIEVSWRLAGAGVQAHILTQRTADGTGHLALEIHPPRSFPAALVRPRELVLAVDVSPTLPALTRALAREAVHELLAELGPADTFQLLRITGDAASTFAPTPLSVGAADHARALAFLAAADDGETTALAGITAALTRPPDRERLRTLILIGDGHDAAVLLTALARLRGDARLYVLGIDAAVDRGRLAAIARLARGAAVFAGTAEPAAAVAARVREQLGRPVLTDIQIDWGDLPIEDLLPAELPDVHLGGSLVIRARLRGHVRRLDRFTRVSGTLGGRPFDHVVQPDDRSGDGGTALAVAWAERRIDDLLGLPTRDRSTPDSREAIVTALGLDLRLTTPYTALFAVEERRTRLPSGELRAIELVADLPATIPQPWPALADEPRPR